MLSKNAPSHKELVEQQGEDNSPKALSYEELVERFREKAMGIPKECWTALFFWQLAIRTQEARIALENQLRQTLNISAKVFWTDGLPDEIRDVMKVDESGFPASEKLDMLRQLENKYVRLTEKELQKTKWYNEVALPAAESKGLGPMLAGGLLWTIGSAGRFATFGKIVKYAGLHVSHEGKAPKRAKGQRVDWNPKLRTLLFKLTEVWNKMPDSVWRAQWDAWKQIYTETRPEILEEVSAGGTPCGKGHIHNMARRKVQREFLRNLYGLWLDYEERGKSR